MSRSFWSLVGFLSGLVFLFAFVSWAQADEFHCGYEDSLIGGGGRGLAPLDPMGPDPIVRFAFVSFPQDTNPVPGILDSDHQAVLDTLNNYFTSHSRGSFVFSGDSDLILPFGQTIGSGQATAWEAELPAFAYRDTAYLPSSYTLSDSAHWWGNSTGWASPLCAEVLIKIQQDLQNNGINSFPETDYLILVFLTQRSPFAAGIDGRARLSINEEVLPSFFDTLARDQDLLRGTCQTFVTENQTNITPREMAKSIAHEIGHTLGLGDGPPSLKDYGWDEGRYYYGNQNLMCQVGIEGEGIPPIGLGWHQHLDWRGSDDEPLVVDFAGENLINLEMKDIRQDGGKIYRFKPDPEDLPDGAVSDQYFLFAYHAGTGLDSQQNAAGDSLYRSTGLEVWHCAGDGVNETPMFDIESAFGLFSDPGDSIGYGFNGNWSTPDATSGYDNRDWWVGRNKYTYAENAGHASDLFSPTNMGTGTDLFNHASNPSTHWYYDDLQEDIIKRKPQSLDNYLWVKIKSQDDANGTMLVDLLTAPYEVVSLASGDTVAVGEPVTVSWTNHHPDLITSVDIFYSANNGQTYRPVATGVDSTQTFVWVPESGDETSHGQLKLVFNNDSNLGGPFIYPQDVLGGAEGIHVTGAPITVSETLLAPVTGQSCFTNNEVRIEWTSFFNDAAHGGHGLEYGVDVSYVGLEVLVAGSWQVIAGNIFPFDSMPDVPIYHYDPDRQVNFYTWRPEMGFVSPDCQLRLTLHYTQSDSFLTNVSTSLDEFPVYPITLKYLDKTEEVNLKPGDDSAGYTGTPDRAIALDVDGDDDLELLVGMGADSEGKSWLYGNTQDGFEKVLSPFPQDSEPLDHNLCTIQGDFNQDLIPDLFLGHHETPQLFASTGGPLVLGYEAVEDSLPSEIQVLLEGTTCAAWVDLQHDGDLDLVLGRISGGNPEVTGEEYDQLIINNGPYATWQAIQLGSSPTEATSISVLDYDKDGFWDIFLSTQGNGMVAFEENALGEYQEQAFRPQGWACPDDLDSFQCADMNNDGWFDLLINPRDTDGALLLNDKNGGFYFSTDWELGDYSQFSVWDFNNDGRDDLFSIPNSISQPHSLKMNLSNYPGFPDQWAEVAVPTGFNALASPMGANIAAPFSPDGTPDLFLGQNVTQGRFWQAVDLSDTTSSPNLPWVDFKLEAANGSNQTIHGAVVKLETSDGHKQWRFVDGGSGNGSQKSPFLHFGLDQKTAPLSYTVYWPSGMESSGTIGSIPDSVFTISAPQLSTLDIGIQAVTVKSALLPRGKQDIHISWKTPFRCETPAIQVVLEDPHNIPPTCDMGATIFTPHSTGVDFDMSLGSDGLFWHEMVIRNVDCEPGCEIDFRIQCGVGSAIQTSGVYTIYHESCGISIQGGF